LLLSWIIIFLMFLTLINFFFFQLYFFGY
jgi:hypothetical protein